MSCEQNTRMEEYSLETFIQFYGSDTYFRDLIRNYYFSHHDNWTIKHYGREPDGVLENIFGWLLKRHYDLCIEFPAICARKYHMEYWSKQNG